MAFVMFLFWLLFDFFPAEDEFSLVESSGTGGSGIVAKVTFLLLLTALAVVVGIVFFELGDKRVAVQQESAHAPVIQEPVTEEFIAPSPINPEGIETFFILFKMVN